MLTNPVRDDGRERLAVIQRLWNELQAARKDPATYEAIAARLRREADAFLRAIDPDNPQR